LKNNFFLSKSKDPKPSNLNRFDFPSTVLIIDELLKILKLNFSIFKFEFNFILKYELISPSKLNSLK